MLTKRTKVILGVLATTGVLFIILIATSVRSVSTGTVQVVTNFGKVTGRVLQPGLNTIVPIINNTLTFNTEKIIQKLWIEKWNGELPVVMGQGTNLMDVSSILPNKKK